MKKLLIIAIVLLLIPLVSAGELKTIEITNDDNLVSLNVRDALAFSYAGGDHRLMVRGIADKGVDLKLFINIQDDKSNEDSILPYYVTLKEKKDIVNLDLNRDNQKDVTVLVADVSNNKVLINIKKYNEGIPVAEETAKETGNGLSIGSIIWTVVLALAAIGLLILVLKKKSK